ncbi:lipase family protein [Thalassospira lucentensis]|uniref:lipase family protein n=1 Tax=Thalassospira lucentensis TaxID=168935 RepID=UPI00138B1A12|nr:triacylglycerol lipase [Thalassospira lucentensis]
MSYSREQTVFSLCMAANAVADIQAVKGETGDRTELTEYMKIALSGGDLKAASQDGAFKDWNGPVWKGFFPEQDAILDGGDWKVVWGPSVYVEHPNEDKLGLRGYAANSMYVAYSAARSTYVLAIAGTNPKNLSDWTEEDLDVQVNKTAKWPLQLPFDPDVKHKDYSTEDPQVSGSTAFGISNLLTKMKDPTTGLTVDTFLEQSASSADTLVFTGHSLGGALAPSLAFHLYPSPPEKWANIEIYPYAGPTPGNAAWLTKFESAYPSVQDYMNIHDVVPHGWNEIDVIISERKTALTDNGSGIAKGEEYYDSIFGVIRASKTYSGVGEAMTAMVATLKGRPDGVGYANITHNKHGAEDFSQNWGKFNWSHPLENTNYVINIDPEWQEWPTFTLENPITVTNPDYDADLKIPASQIGNLIYATHIYQYYSFMDVTPVQMLPAVK